MMTRLLENVGSFVLEKIEWVGSVILLLVVLSIHLAMVVTRLEEDRRTLTEQVAILRHDLDRLESRMEGQAGPQ